MEKQLASHPKKVQSEPEVEKKAPTDYYSKWDQLAKENYGDDSSEQDFQQESDDDYPPHKTLELKAFEDALPMKIKEDDPTAKFLEFFQGRPVPDLLVDYDNIGFDTCLVQYDKQNILDLVTDSFLEDLSDNFDYPALIKGHIYPNESDYEYVLKKVDTTLVWDINRGLLLCLSVKQRVKSAYLGFDQLKNSRIQEIYGDPPVFEALNWPETMRQMQGDNSHWVLMGKDSYLVPTILKVCYLINEKRVEKTYSQFAFDLLEVHHSHFRNFTTDSYKPIASYGKIYPAIHKHPAKYIKYQPELRDILTTMRSHSKTLFIVTDSHIEFINLVMIATLGLDWKNFFDFCIVDARKPLFFRSDSPFYSVDPKEKVTLRGEVINSAQDLGEKLACGDYFFSQGNAKMLSEHFQAQIAQQDIQVAFLGQNYGNDIDAVWDFNKRERPTLETRDSKPIMRWDSIAIIHDQEYAYKAQSSDTTSETVDKFIVRDKQGAAYFFNEDADTVNMFILHTAHKARYVLPACSPEYLKQLIPRDDPDAPQVTTEQMTRANGLDTNIKDMTEFGMKNSIKGIQQIKQQSKEKTPEEKKKKRDARRDRMEANWIFTNRKDCEQWLQDNKIPFQTKEHEDICQSDLTISDLQKQLVFDGEFEGAKLVKCMFLEHKKRKRKRRWLVVVSHETQVDLEELGTLFGCRLRDLDEEQYDFEAPTLSLRHGSEEFAKECLGLQNPVAENIFSIVNDKRRQIQLVFDRQVLEEFKSIASFTMESSSMTALTAKGLRKFIHKCGNTPMVLDFKDLSKVYCQPEDFEYKTIIPSAHEFYNQASCEKFLKSKQISFVPLDIDEQHPVDELLENLIYTGGYKAATQTKVMFLAEKKKTRKKRFWFVITTSETEVDMEALRKHFRVKPVCLRQASDKQKEQILGVKSGQALDLFAIMNDTQEKVKVVIDKQLVNGDFDLVAFKPFTQDSVLTLGYKEISKILQFSRHQPECLDIQNLGVEEVGAESPDEAPVQKEPQKKREREFTATGKFKYKKVEKVEEFVSLQQMVQGSDESVIYGESDSEINSDDGDENSDIKLTDLDVLSKRGVKKSILQEAIKVRMLFRNLGRLVVAKSKWYLVSQKWVKKWEHFCFFNEICQVKEKGLASVHDTEREDPGPIDCSDIIAQVPEQLFDGRPEHTWENVQLKPDLKEGTDFIIVDQEIIDAWSYWYGRKPKSGPIVRYAVKTEDSTLKVNSVSQNELLWPKEEEVPKLLPSKEHQKYRKIRVSKMQGNLSSLGELEKIKQIVENDERIKNKAKKTVEPKFEEKQPGSGVLGDNDDLVLETTEGEDEGQHSAGEDYGPESGEDLEGEESEEEQSQREEEETEYAMVKDEKDQGEEELQEGEESEEEISQDEQDLQEQGESEIESGESQKEQIEQQVKDEVDKEAQRGVVELYLKKFKITVYPNQGLYNFDKAMAVFISRDATVAELEKKLTSCLDTYLYHKCRRRDVMCVKIRLWKTLASDQQKLKSWDDQYQANMKVSVEASQLIPYQGEGELELAKQQCVDDLGLTPADVILVEMIKQGRKSFQWTFEEIYVGNIDKNKKTSEEKSVVTLADLNEKDIEDKLTKQSAMGLVGLKNLGNTCFMNSGLQCLSNTEELTKYFLFGFYKKELNFKNPLGLGGKLATSYASFIRTLWQEKNKVATPKDIKKTLGKRVEKFSGFGQQDSAELTFWLLDLLHEDCNRVKDKPYKEIDEMPDATDEQIAQEYWNSYINRNRSIVVDLMAGQLKSTVTCLQCQNVARNFDPITSIHLPIPRFTTLDVTYVPYDLSGDKQQVKEMPCVDIHITGSMTAKDLKEMFSKRMGVVQDNLRVCLRPQDGLIFKFLEDDYKLSLIDSSEFFTMVYEVQPAAVLPSLDAEFQNDLQQVENNRNMQKQIKLEMLERARVKYDRYSEDVVIELHFYRSQETAEKIEQGSIIIEDAIPRLESFKRGATVLQMKKQLAKKYAPEFRKGKDMNEIYKILNDSIEFSVEDNLPQISHGTKGFGPQVKAKCEFCNKRHYEQGAMCELKIGSLKANDFESSQQVRLSHILFHMKTKRSLVLAVEIRPSLKADFDLIKQNVVQQPSQQKFFNPNAVQGDSGDEHDEGCTNQNFTVSLNACFNQFSKTENLSGLNKWYCNKCKDHVNITKQMELYKVPKIMVLHLKRFSSSGDSGGLTGLRAMIRSHIRNQVKVTDKVDYPLKGLDMRPYVIGLQNEKKPVYYDLYAVSNHYGDLNGGHYTASCLNPVNEKWYYFNDSTVSPIEDPENSVVSKAAYLLFYRRRGN